MPALIGIASWIVAALIGGFGQSIMHGLVKLLIALGFGFITYQGVDVLINYLMQHAYTSFSAVTPEMMGMLGTLKIDKALNVLASAYSARLVIQGVTSGLMTKFGITK